MLSADEALQLMRNVLKDKFPEERTDDYRILADFLANRPYAVRLAAGYLDGALDPCPKQLLLRLQKNVAAEIDDKYSFGRLEVLLKDCLEQLGNKSSLGMLLVEDLSLCADEGMNAKRFMEWQERSRKEVPPADIETAATTARDFGILLVEDDEQEIDGYSGSEGTMHTGLAAKRFRLHTDMVKVIREG